jgi:hypothetical protein
MATITLDTQLQQAMREFLMAINRVQNAEERGDVGRITQLQREQAAAEQAYVGALVMRGWRAPSATPLVSLID